MRKVNFGDKEIFIQYLLDRLGILTDSYNVQTCSSITFTYIVKEGVADDTRQLLHQSEYQVTSHSYNNIKLPMCMDPSEYGVMIGKLDIDNGVQYVVKSDSRIYTIESYATHNIVRIEGAGDFTWKDIRIDDNLFKRVIGKNTIYIKYGEVVVRSKQLSAKPFAKVNRDKKLTPNSTFMTMDIETVNIDKNMFPYLICAYNKDNFISSFINDIHSDSDRIHCIYILFK